MKVNIDKFFSSHESFAGGLSAVLLFGPDRGLISETISKCIEAVAGSPADPFMVSELTLEQLKSDPPKLLDELYALPMAGPRKIVIVRQASDSIVPALQSILATPVIPNFLLVEGGDLAPRSKLRKIFESGENIGAAGCYEDNHNNLNTIIREVMNLRKVRIDSEAVLEIGARLGNDRMVSRSEIEKLALYAGEDGRIAVNDVLDVIGDNSAISLEKVVFFTADGNTKLADQSLARALADGISPIQVLRALQTHLQRLHLVTGELKSGVSMNAAIAKLKPPVFFKVKSRFQEQCQNWSSDQLVLAMDLILRAEQQSKQTGAPLAAICQRAVLRLAIAAQLQKNSRS